MTLTIDETVTGDWVVVKPTGRIDTLTAKDLETHLAGVISAARGAPVLDLAEVDFISSFGLRVILITAKKLMAEGKSFPLCNLSADVKSVFDVSGFSKILPIHGTLEDVIGGASGAGG